MNKKTVIANFKMNKTNAEVKEYIKVFKKLVKGKDANIGICVPFTDLALAAKMLKKTGILVGAQNMNENDKGAYTGEVSSAMLKDIGVYATLIGHSERRSYYNETNATVNKKVAKALAEGIRPIVCIGENLDERNNGKTNAVLKKQLTEGFKDIDVEDFKDVIIAYEPVWAIGTGVVPTNKQIVDAMASIRKTLTGIYNADVAEATIIQYGGSVNEKNAAEIASLKGVDGALVGGAGLDPNKFNAIIDGFLAAK